MRPSKEFLQHGHCTATAVDGSATADGGCIAATSADGTPMDFRLVYVRSSAALWS
ncbi:hypothetical protein Pmar_PMAR008794 [Perkinsus marinus ATCC 50983]|uniref:Uncharacterized protein n=1 Tax=Perkinsus marinus (strain ATCC 50983 / TXsc) TaxID=423536 RepID=C5L113_PERM5|nr:hypothetical protein Pmar_PMAR008794 [Perkinsus marinus ATCC 50983]EER09655.1 hypothetical protein Pmar_PMAR008794 [Perkinsus marinus ATCC 50983]|eukprot:XP_002777860.1 hypothetical protein Pmar_PMAR008794 [Perkinsus marinus ATCC 50983]